MRSCRDVRARLFAAAEGTLPIEETLALEEHARNCRACAREMRGVQRLHEAFARLPQPPVERVDVDVQVERIRAAIARLEQGGPGVARISRGRTGWVVARWLAAGVMLGAAFGWWLAREGARSSRDDAPPVAHVEPSAHGAAEEGLRGLDATRNTRETRDVASVDVDAPLSERAAQGPELAAPSPELPLPPEPVDLERLDAARATVRAALVDAAPALASRDVDAAPHLPDRDVDAFLKSFDETTIDLARENWPFARLVERVVDDADPVAWDAAIAWLGRRGDTLAARRLGALLEDPRRKQASAAALVELGPAGRDALAQALLDPELRAGVLDGVARRDAVAAGNLVVKATTLAPRALDPMTALDEIARRRLRSASSWTEGLVRERLSRGDAATAGAGANALAEVGGVDALRALLRLRDHARAAEGGVPAALDLALSRPDGAAADLARELASSNRGGKDLRALHDALLEVPCPAIAPALVVVAGSRELTPSERRFAILLVGEQGTREDVPALADLFRRLDRRDKNLKATILVVLHALGGRDASAEVLADLPRATRERALELLDGADAAQRPETTLLQITRELEPKLAPLQL